jgi:hypothetical protein
MIKLYIYIYIYVCICGFQSNFYFGREAFQMDTFPHISPPKSMCTSLVVRACYMHQPTHSFYSIAPKIIWKVLTFKILYFYISRFRQSAAPHFQSAMKMETAAASSVCTTANVKWHFYRIPVPCKRHIRQSICLSLYIEQLGSHATNFYEIWY